jgi:hypothetical protein
MTNITQDRGQGDEVADFSAAHADTTDEESDARAPHYHSSIPTSVSPSLDSAAETLSYEQQQQPHTHNNLAHPNTFHLQPLHND